jgi:hypothetical protein
MTRLGVKAIPQWYILKRWTQEAVLDNKSTAPNAHVQTNFIARGMPLNNKKNFVVYQSLYNVCKFGS